MRVRLLINVLLLLGALVLAACGGGAAGTGATLEHGTYPVPDGPGGALPPSPPPEPGEGSPTLPELSGGVLVTVDTEGEIWRWWVTNPTTATYLERAWNGTYTGHFGGRIRGGPGAASHNAPWSWHLDPEVNSHAVVLYRPPGGAGGPATPSECESQLALWLSQDATFVSYPFHIVAFEDRRP